MTQDHHWMQQALAMADRAQAQGEVPIGAVIVLDNQLISTGWNQPINQNDPTAHAEIAALRAAAQTLQNYRLLNTTIYVTLEPCVMCLGALIHARVKRLVYGAPDTKIGAIASHFHLLEHREFNHRIEWEGGCLANECTEKLKNFFQQKR